MPSGQIGGPGALEVPGETLTKDCIDRLDPAKRSQVEVRLLYLVLRDSPRSEPAAAALLLFRHCLARGTWKGVKR